MSKIKEFRNQYKLKTAYPTIALTVIAIAVYASSSFAAYNGNLSIAWSIFINTIMAYLLFTPMHEASHLNISGNNKSMRWINELVGWMSSIPLFSPYYVFKVIHFRHHAFTNDPEKDPDHWLASKNWFSLLFHSVTIFPVYIIKGIQLLLFEDKIVEKVKRDLRIGLINLFFLILLFITMGFLIGWGLVFKLWVLPAALAQVLLAFSFDWLPHHPHQEKGRYQNTRIMDISGLSILLLGQNYHLIHHLYPRIPFYDYKKTYSNIKDELIKEGTEIISLKQKDV